MTYAGETRSRLKLDRNEDLIKRLGMQKPTQSEIMYGCFSR